jgi:small multidrug resistance pump
VNADLTLAAAIASEVAGTTALKYADGFTEPLPSAVVVVGYLGAFYLLSLTLRELPVGLVYATWSAVGIVAAAGIGAVLFDESLDAAAVAGLGLRLAGVVVLNVFSEAYAPAH